MIGDYPGLAREQVEAAAEYARAYPKRGRPYPRRSLKRMLAELDLPDEEDLRRARGGGLGVVADPLVDRPRERARDALPPRRQRHPRTPRERPCERPRWNPHRPREPAFEKRAVVYGAMGVPKRLAAVDDAGGGAAAVGDASGAGVPPVARGW